MNLDKDPESWSCVKPDAVMSGSDAQARNVLTMALRDIATLASEVERLKSERNHAWHRYGDNEQVPPTAKLAHAVSVVRCSCGQVCIRFHKPATYTNPGQVFAAAFLDRKDCAAIGDDVLKSLDICRHVMPCSGQH